MVSKVKDESSLTFDIIKEAFSKKQEWQQAFDLQSDLNLREFFESSQFSESTKQPSGSIDEERFYLFACYCCRSDKAKTTLITNHIRQELNEKDEKLIGRAYAKQILDSIFKLASTGMLKSLAEIKFMEDFYTTQEFETLSNVQEKICE